MMGQSNDWFYALAESGIDLFENGVVRNAKDVKYGSTFTKVSSVMRVTITPAKAPGAN